jgi:hypothetical protein
MCRWFSKARRRANAKRTYLQNTVATYEGICLCDLSIYKRDTDNFIECTKKALDLIKENDSRRFLRIQRFIAYVVNQELVSGGNYDEFLRVCNVDFSFFKVRENFEWYILQYAALLVHESTHGLVAARGIPYNKKTRQRIEAFCRTEEKRFFGRISSPWELEDLAGPYDEHWLKEYWGFWSRMKLIWKRAREILCI